MGEISDDNIYFRLTREFNQGRGRAILSSSQAVVYYRLSMQSKDCEWIIRGDGEALDYQKDIFGKTAVGQACQQTKDAGMKPSDVGKAVKRTRGKQRKH